MAAVPGSELEREGDGQVGGQHVHIALTDRVDHRRLAPVQQVPCHIPSI